jgi:predicted HTH domain antitoxin
MSSRAVTARLKIELLKEIQEIAKEESIDRSSAIQRLIKIGLKQYRMEKAINLYRDGKVTLWKAAETAGISLREMMETIKARDIPYQYDFEALEEYVDELLAKRKTIDA